MSKYNMSILCFYDKEGKILLQGRKNISKWGAEWGFFGGKIEEGETPEQAIVREICEELSYTIRERRYVGNVSFDNNDINVTANI
ncbi:MAG: NUDIX domain-containing protein [archaeon]